MEELPKEPKCITHESSRSIRLSMNSKLDQEGIWVDTVSGWTENSNTSKATNIDITNTITECQGRRVMHIKGVTQATMHNEKNDILKFHPRCGKNIAVLNKGLTVQKLNFEERCDAMAFTNRPLRDEEIFEVKLDGRKYEPNMGIGIMTKSPTDIDIIIEMYKSPFVWIYHDVNFYNNTKIVKKNIGKDTRTFQVGDRVGVMRSEMGTLHFFYNGEDQGPAMSNVPPNVYGVLDLRGGFEKASIV